MFRLLSRRKAAAPLPVLAAPAADRPVATAVAAPAAAPVALRPAGACALSACLGGSRVTVLDVGCGDAEACRLRALGLCEGASVNVVRSRDHTLLEVRGSRLAVGAALASGITVLPVA